ncbi:MAG: DUF3006 domain-containing protein [Acutalibacteraceae bacterium]
MKYSVDRIEANLAILIDEAGNRITIPENCLPNNAKPGSMLFKENDRYLLDSNETERRKKKLYDLQNSLFSDKN